MVTSIHGVKIHFEIMGEGKPLLLLHGWGGCVNSMAPIWQFFKRNFKVYVIDFPGQNNESGVPEQAWGIPEYADVVKSFMEEQSIEQPDVIAHSFGGRVAIYLASQEPSLFRRIVLVDAAGIKPKKTIKQRIKQVVFRCGKLWLKCISSKEQYEERITKLRKKYASPDYLAIQTEVMRQTFKNVISLDLTNHLAKIQNPTLIVWGENDQDTPLYMAKIMEKKIPDAGLVVLKEAGHFSYLDKTGNFNLIVSQFLCSK